MKKEDGKKKWKAEKETDSKGHVFSGAIQTSISL